MNERSETIVQALRRARWLPANDCSADLPAAASFAAGEDLLPLIAGAWSQAGLPARQRRRADRLRTWAEQQMAAGAHLTVGPGPLANDVFTRWAGQRLIWWPTGFPRGQRIGLLSSHVGRGLHPADPWLQAFRAACGRFDRDRDVIVTAATSTPHALARRAARQFRWRLLEIIPPGRRRQWPAWLDALVQQTGASQADSTAHISPEYSPPPPGGQAADSPSGPLADGAVIALSEQVLVLKLRRRGRLRPLIRQRLHDPAWGPDTVEFVRDEQLVPPDVASELRAAGARDRDLSHPGVSPGHSSSSVERSLVKTHLAASCPAAVPATSAAAQPSRPAPVTPRRVNPRVIPRPRTGDWCYLTHWTRAASGPWPDETQDEYLDALLSGSPAADRGPLATLLRIVEQQRIVSTSRGIRGAVAVVSLTDIPLDELPDRRTFRAHRGRWDFEPYGVCLRRDRLCELGARPVVYGEPADWERLAPGDRPYFQRRFSRANRAGMPIDWSREREWRILGDLDLRQFDDSSAFVFVPSSEEAHRLLPYSRWPLVVLGEHSLG